MSKPFQLTAPAIVPEAFFTEVLLEVDSLEEMKVLLVIIYMSQRVGEAKLSLSQLEQHTGLGRDSVIAGVEAMLKRGYVYRRQEGQSLIYGFTA